MVEVCYFKFFAYVPTSKTSKKKQNNDALRMKEGGELCIRGNLVNYLRLRLFQKNLNASKLSKHPPLVFFTLTDRDSTIPRNNIHTYVVANPVRGLLDRKRSQEHLRKESSNESMETKRKTTKEGTITQSTCQKKI